MQATAAAISTLDNSEVFLRDAIERGLSYVAGVHGIRIGEAMQATEQVMQKVRKIRGGAVAAAISKFGPETINGRPVAVWGKIFEQNDLARIDSTIRSGVLAGFDNTEIARKVVGSLPLNGIDGTTEITRRHFTRLGHAILKAKESV